MLANTTTGGARKPPGLKGKKVCMYVMVSSKKRKNLNITSIVSFLKKHCPDNEADYNLMDWTI